MSQVQGPCEGHYPHWGYDADTKKCENFIYGGCLGNNNRSVKSVCNKSTCFKSVFLNQHLLISNFALEQIRQPRRVRGGVRRGERDHPLPDGQVRATHQGGSLRW